MLKSLILKNFQKHSNLQIDFVDGVNVLTGASDAGKSCIRRSIEWVYGINSFGDAIRKIGTKQTSVQIILDNGYWVERIKSSSINRYIIYKGDDKQVFDSIGRTIPSEVQEVLDVFPIEIDGEEIYLNSYVQVGKPFLFNKSPSFRMKLFNSLTGNDVLDRLFGQFNKDILKIKRNKKEEESRFEDRSIELKNKKTEMEKAVEKHKRLKSRLESLKVKYEKYFKLFQLKELMNDNELNRKNIKDTLKSVNIPEDTDMKQLMINITDFDVYKRLINGLEKVNINIGRVSDQLKGIKPVTLDFDDLRGKIERFESLKSIYEKLSQNKGLLKDIKKDIKIIDMDIKQINKEFNKYEICNDCDGRGVKFNEI